jgi:hypothetical protein
MPGIFPLDNYKTLFYILPSIIYGPILSAFAGKVLKVAFTRPGCRFFLEQSPGLFHSCRARMIWLVSGTHAGNYVIHHSLPQLVNSKRAGVHYGQKRKIGIYHPGGFPRP